MVPWEGSRVTEKRNGPAADAHASHDFEPAPGTQPPLRRAGTCGATTTPANETDEPPDTSATRTPGISRVTCVSLLAELLSSTQCSGFASPRTTTRPGSSPVMSTHWRSSCAL